MIPPPNVKTTTTTCMAANQLHLAMYFKPSWIDYCSVFIIYRTTTLMTYFPSSSSLSFIHSLSVAQEIF
ncbi:hypothetical protein DERP_002707 [Dermatophagoides pteronyssinus]|uniref:Uncharacterized protein n=1 Tax=Dermatophagoides pteronyssinus TaxID=6956 RepID=A0ABQ8JVH6_DERPT|nr:hypothetical protein DERP_002707 [Dermatophagoides pteronyssinus]